MKLNELFTQIFVINVNSLTERWRETESILKNIGINSYERFPGIIINEGKSREDRILGCKLSHIEVIKKAKKLLYKSVLILEDDIEFDNRYLNNVDSIVEGIRSFLNTNDWHLFYLGGNHEKEPQRTLNANVVKVALTKTTHAYAVNYNCFEQIINFESSGNIPIDDLFYSNIQTQKKSFCSYPRLFSQRAGQSYILDDYRNNNYCLLEN